MADYYSIIAHVVSHLPSNTEEARHAIYQRARTALRDKLGAFDPVVAANEEAVLEAAITAVEMDLLLTIMQRFVREEPAPPGPRFVSKLGHAVCAVITKLINRNGFKAQRAIDGLTQFFLRQANELRRLLNSGIRPLLR